MASTNSVKGKALKKALQIAGTVGLFSAYAGVRSWFKKHKVVVLAYHRVDLDSNYPWTITPVTPDIFELEMEYLHRNYHVIPLDELCNALENLDELPPNTAVVTIDDGYKDVYTNAYPVLKKYNIPATVFLTTGLIGTGELLWTHKVRYLIWETKLDKLELQPLGTYSLNSDNSRILTGNTIVSNLKKIPRKTRDEYIERLVKVCGVDVPDNLGKDLFLNWDEVRAMNNNGINFGAHTVNHPILSRISLDEAKSEILNSKQHIERELGQEVTTFCYPNGEPADFNDEIVDILRDNGFTCSVTLVPEAFATPETGRYRIPRITGASGFETFELLMSGLYSDVFTILKGSGNNS
jgi:peptidoglycan/xylan/chitin deacetylase (PgdA/CDA1 family)